MTNPMPKLEYKDEVEITKSGNTWLVYDSFRGTRTKVILKADGTTTKRWRTDILKVTRDGETIWTR